jgi:hypothetical protein
MHGEPRAFLRAAVESQTNECIVWKFSKASAGYGTIFFGGRYHNVHRLALQMAIGDPSHPNLVAAHAPGICHNPSCINPRHLRWATDEENAADRIIDGTENRGSRQHHAKLTEEQALRIFDDQRPRDTIAAEFGVSRRCVGAIKTGSSWAWLTGARNA